MELRVGGKYRLSRKLGCGAFGDIYHGKFFLNPNRVFFRVQAPTLKQMRRSP
jgi:hypothetical protein